MGARPQRRRLRREGTRRYYRANRDGLGPLAGYLEAMWATQVDRLAVLAETAEEPRQ